MSELELEEYLAEGAERLVAAIKEAQLLVETDDLWAAALEVERIRAEIEASTGVSVIEPMPSGGLADALDIVGRVTAEQAAKFLGATPRNDHGRVGGAVAP